jgi:hypothetical protein
MDPQLDTTVPALIHWVSSVFGTEDMDAIKEQTWCYEPMGSHTARYASICAMWFARTGEEWYRDQAERFFNFATYMTDENGVVRVGPNWPGSWFSDGYGDYIRHFLDGLAAIPEWSPSGEDHLLKTTSVIQQIDYNENHITYKTFDEHSREILRLHAKPSEIHLDSEIIIEMGDLNMKGWTWKELEAGGILELNKYGSKSVSIIFND